MNDEPKIWRCHDCTFISYTPQDMRCHWISTGHNTQDNQTNKHDSFAQRDSVSFRYDILDPEFLAMMARVADYGAKKYGDFNWQKSRLSGKDSPINHIYEHLRQYREKIPYDHTEVGTDPSFHLIAIAFNAMMEYWYEVHEL